MLMLPETIVPQTGCAMVKQKYGTGSGRDAAAAV